MGCVLLKHSLSIKAAPSRLGHPSLASLLTVLFCPLALFVPYASQELIPGLWNELQINLLPQE